jgi:hypothetical protein
MVKFGENELKLWFTYLEKNESTRGWRGVPLFNKIISNRREIGRAGGGTGEIWAAGGETVYNLTRARAAPLFEVWWLGRGWPICRATLLLSAVLTQLRPIIWQPRLIICGVSCIKIADTKNAPPILAHGTTYCNPRKLEFAKAPSGYRILPSCHRHRHYRPGSTPRPVPLLELRCRHHPHISPPPRVTRRHLHHRTGCPRSRHRPHICLTPRIARRHLHHHPGHPGLPSSIARPSPTPAPPSTGTSIIWGSFFYR